MKKKKPFLILNRTIFVWVFSAWLLLLCLNAFFKLLREVRIDYRISSTGTVISPFFDIGFAVIIFAFAILSLYYFFMLNRKSLYFIYGLYLSLILFNVLTLKFAAVIPTLFHALFVIVFHAYIKTKKLDKQPLFQ